MLKLLKDQILSSFCIHVDILRFPSSYQKETSLHQVNQCSYFPSERTNLAQSSVRGPMDSLLGKLPREGGKSLLEGLLRADSKLLGNDCP
ncbi:hypothetical protein AQUCO_00100048v1 [Aquilegia coerulea]|uniref:Uncharacterized protein n=1 Tax=Aquilegia coerulea TaxID=218851 RepID=A0A2G5F8N3_AQUCA|nr:hypothetical protein AQUCO_00100048v1 [Aquilegia coerulea]